MKTLSKLLILTLYLGLVQVYAAPGKVGNGDDGTDLQSFKEITSGEIFETRKDAVKLLDKLNVENVQGLGTLKAEVERTKLYMTKEGLSTQKLAELGAFKEGGQGLIYARTFPRAHAATRFFPATKTLDKDQLITLHIHEGLHRSLPKNIREEEEIVSHIASTITGPGANFDYVNEVVSEYLVEDNRETRVAMESKAKLIPAPHSRLNLPSRFTLGYKRYAEPENASTNDLSIPLTESYTISSHLYPFGEGAEASGLGIDFNFLKEENDSYIGPLGLSLRRLVWTKRGFDIEAYAKASLNMLSNEELKNSIFGRDVYKLGVTFAKRSSKYYIENDLEYTLKSSTNEQIGLINYEYNFGSVIGARVRFGYHFKNLLLGGFGEVLLSDNFQLKTVDSDAINLETGRNRIVSVGPQIRYKTKDYSIDLYGRMLIDSTKDTDFDFLGDLIGTGAGQGTVGLNLNWYL